MSRMVLVIGAVLMLLPTSSPGQALVRSLGGDYILTYTDLNDTLRTVEIEATDQVQPTTTVQVAGSGGLFVYRYILANGSTARRALAFLDVPCPAADPMLAATGPTSWNAKAGVSGKLDGIGGLELCSFSFRDDLAEVLPGTTLIGLQITSAWLPAVRAARAYGLVETVLMPTSHEDTPDTVYTLVERAQGFGFFTGGGRAVPVVVPARPPAVLADPGPGLDSIAVDLSQSCALGWITDPSTCAALAARLDQARQALSQGNATGARTGVESFLASLDGAHGQGLPVNDNAFWLLTVNAEFIRDLLPAEGAAVPRHRTDPPALGQPSQTPPQGEDIDSRSTTMNAEARRPFQNACRETGISCDREPNPPQFHLSPQGARQR